MRYYVISDVHGYYTQMKSALEKAGFFSDTTPHKLIMLGDLFDRGHEAKQLQQFILEQMEQDKIILIRGNHEDLFVELVTTDAGMPYSYHKSNGTYDTALQLTGFDPVMASIRHYDFADAAKDTPFYKEIIPAMLDYFETEHYVFTHGWIPSIPNRDKSYSYKSRTINGTGCPYCSHNKVLAGFNDLASQYPDIAAEWSDRNLPLLPTMVTAFANSKAWWKCRDCGNEWYTLISTRAGGSRCPYCSGYTLLKGFNDLATTHPDLAAEWSERNYPLMPDEVNAKSRHNVWWKCKTCGNEWKSVINARVKGTVCPVCADRAVLAGYNDLATTDRKLLAEWDYEKNSLLPTQVSRKSMKSVWWKCSLGHSWKAKISDRTIIGEKCTVCESEYRSVFPGLAVAYYANQKGLKVQLGSDKLLGIPLETYIPSEKLAIEFTNGSEHMEVLKSHLCKQRNIKLVKLPFKTTETETEYR